MEFHLNPPCLVFYRNHLGTARSGKPAAGQSNCFFVWIRSDMKDEPGVREHEFEHVRQFYRTLGLHPFLLLIPKYRQWCEKKALAIQLKIYEEGNNAGRK